MKHLIEFLKKFLALQFNFFANFGEKLKTIFSMFGFCIILYSAYYVHHDHHLYGKLNLLNVLIVTINIL